MKKIIPLFICCLLLVTGSFAQGIEFEHGTWAEVLAKAKKENKPIFIDVYTSWCGPCRVMAKNVFTDQQVGDTYNAAFINYKIDAEKGEGIEIAKKYGVRSYPTFLFISPNDQTAFHKESAALPSNGFMALADMALQKGGYAAKGKSSEEYQKEFEAGNRKIDFIMAYMKQNAIEKKSNNQLADTLFNYLPAAQRLQQPYIEILALNVSSVLSPLFGFLAENYEAVNNIINPGNQLFFESAMMAATRPLNAYKGAADATIPQSMNAFAKMIKDKPRYIESYCYGPLGRYYQNVKDTVGFMEMANEYANTLLFPMTKEQLEQEDRDAIAEVKSKLASGEVDSAYYKVKTRNSHVNLEQASIRMSNLAFSVARMGKTQKDKELAEKLIKHSVEINPSANNKVQLAAILQIIGKTDAAQQTLGKVMDINKSNASQLQQRFNALTKKQ